MTRWLSILFILVPFLTACGDRGMAPTIYEVKKGHEERLMSLPGVVSVGVGQNERGEQVIVVGVSHSDPTAQSRIPQVIDNYPVVVSVVGPVKAQ